MIRPRRQPSGLCDGGAPMEAAWPVSAKNASADDVTPGSTGSTGGVSWPPPASFLCHRAAQCFAQRLSVDFPHRGFWPGIDEADGGWDVGARQAVGDEGS